MEHSVGCPLGGCQQIISMFEILLITKLIIQSIPQTLFLEMSRLTFLFTATPKTSILNHFNNKVNTLRYSIQNQFSPICNLAGRPGAAFTVDTFQAPHCHAPTGIIFK